jgi:hypothetical protein
VTAMEDSFLDTFESLDINAYEELEPLTKALESISQSLAQSEDLRWVLYSTSLAPAEKEKLLKI